ncbi:sphingomyelin synthase 2, putative (SMS2) [Babesia microti strain RI]|uniref:Sphingomyelin synthase 2, putative (SMS2) n=1 Tax=Babesia microti (strain RI) TaxID=1133968 RepID=A0A1N6LXN1_BABMR|nr:sphingomyelin synthase 2, putative (SMS2) [Babesia microti strain RI]SIO73639.1 sphingomyelin synthase 2, putative (SMS2) [Babesia microti strain RI]|eukprot:XP_021337717.1 sphingomyelin synthase 2, putative (SMS2) [Babesia microti strain RI]
MKFGDTVICDIHDSSVSFDGIVNRMSSSGSSICDIYRIGSFSCVKDATNNTSEIYDELADLFNVAIRNLFLRLTISTVILILSIIIQAYLMLITEGQYDSSMSPLADRIHEVFKEHKSLPFERVNILISIMVLFLTMRIMIFAPPFQALVNLMRIMLLMGVGYFIRGFFIAATTVPSATKDCVPGSFNSSNKLLTIIGGNFGLSLTCTDNIISGHAFSTILCSLLWFNLEDNVFIHIIIILYTSVICFLIVVTRGHYTIDVLFGIFYAVILYNIYMISLRMKISQVYDWSDSSRIFRKHLELGSFWNCIGHVIGWFELIDIRLRIIKLSIYSQSIYHKEFMGIISDDGCESAFDIISANKMCNKLCFVNMFLFSRFIKSLFHKCKISTNPS